MFKQKLRSVLPFFLSLVMMVTLLGIGSETTQAATVTGNDIVNGAKSLVGKPYKKGSSGPYSFDNWGLTKYVYGKYGITLKSSVAGQAYQGTYIKKGKSLQKGDLVFFGKSTKQILNVGIYIGNNQFIDAWNQSGKVAIHSMTGIYSKYYLGARRVLSTKTVSTTPVSPTTSRDLLAQKVVKNAEKYLGVPYLLGADYDRDGSYKFDCSSFTQKVFANVGIKIPRAAIPQYNATAHNKVAKKDVKVGDLVFFDLNRNGGIDHVGLYIGNGKIIQASTANGGKVQITDIINNKFWNTTWIATTRVF